MNSSDVPKLTTLHLIKLEKTVTTTETRRATLRLLTPTGLADDKIMAYVATLIDQIDTWESEKTGETESDPEIFIEFYDEPGKARLPQETFVLDEPLSTAGEIADSFCNTLVKVLGRQRGSAADLAWDWEEDAEERQQGWLATEGLSDEERRALSGVAATFEALYPGRIVMRLVSGGAWDVEFEVAQAAS